MEAPKCKICGARHYGLCASVKSGEPVRPTVVKCVVPIQEAAIEPVPKFDKTAYQREYMRKRRAAAKA